MEHTQHHSYSMQHTSSLAQHTTTIPRNFKNVVASTEKVQWLVAMQSEVNTLQTNDIFDLVALLGHQHTLGSQAQTAGHLQGLFCHLHLAESWH